MTAPTRDSDLPPIEVTAVDPLTGDTQTVKLGQGDYVVVHGARLEQSAVQRYGNGTIVITLKRVTR
jgi:hypothetical protein